MLEAGTTGGIAIGSNSTLVENSVSFGSLGAERRITNVASGVADTDAVNMAQFATFQTQLTQDSQEGIDALDSSLTQVNSRIDALNARIETLINRLNNL